MVLGPGKAKKGRVIMSPNAKARAVRPSCAQRVQAARPTAPAISHRWGGVRAAAAQLEVCSGATRRIGKALNFQHEVFGTRELGYCLIDLGQAPA